MTSTLSGMFNIMSFRYAIYSPSQQYIQYIIEVLEYNPTPSAPIDVSLMRKILGGNKWKYSAVEKIPDPLPELKTVCFLFQFYKNLFR